MSAMASILVRNVITVPISTSSESPSTVRLKDFILCLFFHFIASEWLKELIPITFEYLTRSVLRLVVRNILCIRQLVSLLPHPIQEKVNLKFIRKQSLLLNIIRIEIHRRQQTFPIPSTYHNHTSPNGIKSGFPPSLPIRKLKRKPRDVETKRHVFNEMGFGIRQSDGNTFQETIEYGIAALYM